MRKLNKKKNEAIIYMIWSLAFVLPTSPHKQHIPFNGQLFMSYKKIASNEMFKMAAPVIKRAKKNFRTV